MLKLICVVLVFKAVVLEASNIYFNEMNHFLKGDEGEKEESISLIFLLIVLKLLFS